LIQQSKRRTLNQGKRGKHSTTDALRWRRGETVAGRVRAQEKRTARKICLSGFFWRTIHLSGEKAEAVSSRVTNVDAQPLVITRNWTRDWNRRVAYRGEEQRGQHEGPVSQVSTLESVQGVVTSIQGSVNWAPCNRRHLAYLLVIH